MTLRPRVPCSSHFLSMSMSQAVGDISDANCRAWGTDVDSDVYVMRTLPHLRTAEQRDQLANASHTAISKCRKSPKTLSGLQPGAWFTWTLSANSSMLIQSRRTFRTPDARLSSRDVRRV